MEVKKKVELKVEKPKAEKKSTWSFKKVMTTIIIAILALLMIGGLSYIVSMIMQSTDTTNVFGKYNGEAIKYEPNTVFYNSLMSNQNYQTAVANGDVNGIYNAWSQAYQSQVLYTALKQKADAPGVRTTDTEVDDLIIDSGVYASEDGSEKFSKDVYNSKTAADRSATYQYFKSIYPYYVVMNDYQDVPLSPAEQKFVADLAADTTSFEYYVIGANAIPDYVAKAVDISGMTLSKDSDGNDVQPTLDDIKSYILSSDPELAKIYIEEAVAKAATTSFDDAATTIGAGIVGVQNAVCNVGNSTYMFNGVQNADPDGYLASAMNDADLASRLFKAEVGTVTDPIKVDNVYIVARVKDKQTNDSAANFVNMMYSNYTPSMNVNELANAILASDKFEDQFMEKFMPILLGSMGGTVSTANVN